MSDGRPSEILIVDDEAPHMTALCNTLRDEGYVMTGFTSANDALAALRHRTFDLLLTDLMMPEMDGIQFLRAALELDRNLVGIMMTGHGTVDTAVEAMKAGALDYILKPFKLRVILPVLSRALAMRQLRMENAKLEQCVRERTTELESANQELEAFSYSVSHDLRAPLRAVDGFTNILLRKHSSGMPEEAKEFLNKIASSANQMGRLIDDLLSLARLGRQPLLMRTVSVTELVTEVLSELRQTLGDRQVNVHVDALPDCQGDPALLKQVFVNLLSNAFKFTRHQKDPNIEVGCKSNGEQNMYFVRDNGAGFDMQYAQRLFGVFQRLHRAEEFEGSGVGLSIVQRIIHRHGGQVWAEAKLNQGATFYFTLADKPKGHKS